MPITSRVSVRARKLPGAVFCLAVALSRGEKNELLQIAQFVRGLAIQTAYRAVCDELLVSDQATVLYSHLDRSRASLVRTVTGVVAATLVGLALFLASNALLMLPVGALMRLAGADNDLVADTALAVAGVRLTWTAYRAVKSYALERRRQKLLPTVSGQPRWRLDLMGATPPRCGHGAALLREFVALSDAAGATVYLVTEPHNRAFYRRAGFHVQPCTDSALKGMLLMRRVTPTARVPAQRVSPAAQTASR